ncbi:hypothetical protein G6F68_017974 [Rhizopus microsporus]|nr:hypothetical protein G6F68_017974 [Rhizopus microsporus]
MVIFNRLSKEALRDIVDVRIKEVEERTRDRRINIEVSKEARDWLGERGYDPAYGARPLNRLIQKKLLNPLARLLIDGGIRTGETAKVTVEKLPVGETDLVIHRNHEPGTASTEEENITKKHLAPVGDEESAIQEDENKKIDDSQ